MPDLVRDPPDLWLRCSGGDAAAREELSRLAHSIAERELARRGVRAAERDDLAQEAVRSTLTNLAAGTAPPRDLVAFLKYRAWGVLSDYRKRMRPRSALSDEATEPTARHEPLDRRLRIDEARAALAECRRRLTADQREALDLRYELDLDADAVAARLGVTPNAVHVRVFRALAALRECLGRKGVDAEDLQ